MAKKSSAVQVVLASRIRELARQNKVRVSGDFVDAANGAVVCMVKKAVERCKANGRQTVRPQDI